ncbi:MAG: polysaccharide deacetylase family protein, partial [Hyphomicrobium sp.]
VKQDENGFVSARTKRTLQSGELLVSLPGEKTAEGWENSDWLVELLDRARTLGIEVFAWYPVFQDATMAHDFPDHVYTGKDKEAFVDPAIPAVRARQETLIRKLVSAYPFDGVALDWIRYNARTDGGKGPLAERFTVLTGQSWTPELMAKPLERAIWDDLRAETIANWITDLTASFRQQKPALKWGAFVLPWQFKEVSQSYRRLGNAGLDFLQPMIYWADWNETPDWTKQVMRGGPFWLAGRTAFWPTFDLNGDEKDILEGVGELSAYRLAGNTWYLHQAWTEEKFAGLGRIGAKWAEAGAPVIETANDIVLDPPSPPVKRAGQRLEPAEFAEDASVWALVCLAELYRSGVLDDTDKVVPVLAFHRFAKGDYGSGKTVWINSTAYLDDLMGFLKQSGFSGVSTSQLEAYMISEDPTILPKRPVTLTIDDGSASILEQFHPRALKAGFPYSISLITSLVKDQAIGETLVDYEASDVILTAAQVRDLIASGKVEMLSHTHNLHFYGPEDEDEKESGPAMTTPLWLKDRERQETNAEWQRRIYTDLVKSRQQLLMFGATGPNILTWPYGEFNETSLSLAGEAGFNAYLSFSNSSFAAPKFDNQTIARVSVTRADEAVPLKMPSDAIAKQRWWLSFLRWCRSAASPELIEAALGRLEGEQKSHPEAEITRASLEALNGLPDSASTRIEALKKTYPHDAVVHSSIDEFLKIYAQVF